MQATNNDVLKIYLFINYFSYSFDFVKFVDHFIGKSISTVLYIHRLQNVSIHGNNNQIIQSMFMSRTRSSNFLFCISCSLNPILIQLSYTFSAYNWRGTDIRNQGPFLLTLLYKWALFTFKELVILKMIMSVR